jgi:hypothetical protein
MRAKTLLFSSIVLFIFGTLVFLWACNKHAVGSIEASSVISDAKAYFEANVANLPAATGAQAANPSATLHKTPLWNRAYTQELDMGDSGKVTAIIVPISIKEPITLKRSNGNFSISLSLLTRLILYKDRQQRYHSELVTAIPDENSVANYNASRQFSGLYSVEDWQGNYLKGYHFLNGIQDKFLSSRTSTSNLATSQGRTISTGVQTTVDAYCYTTEYYSCSVYDGIYTDCNLYYTNSSCVELPTNGTGDIYQMVYNYPPSHSGASPDWVENPNYRFCSNLSFSSDGNGNYILNLNNLQHGWTSPTLGSVSFSFPNTCVTIPSSGKTQLDASAAFEGAYEYGLDQLDNELWSGVTTPANSLSRFVYLVQSKLTVYGPGTWDPFENCSSSAITISNSQCLP